MPRERARLYAATNGVVLALDAASGDEVWRTKLPRGGGMGAVFTLLMKNDWLFVAGNGRAWCLDRRTGALLWENGLPRTGYHSVMLAIEGATAATPAEALAAAEHQRQAAAAAAAGSTAAT